jgi:hypothetical protein
MAATANTARRVQSIDDRLAVLTKGVRHLRHPGYVQLDQTALGLQMKALRERREELLAQADRAAAEREAQRESAHWDRLLFPAGPPAPPLPPPSPPPPSPGPLPETVGDWADVEEEK